MTGMRVVLAMLALGVTPAWAEQWWVSYEATGTLPEDEGFERYTNAGGAERYFEDDALVLDGLASIDIGDIYRRDIPSYPSSNQIFRMEWRLRVSALDGFFDPAVDISFGPHGDVVLTYQMDRVYSVSEAMWIADITPGVFHDYVFTSSDLANYTLYIDGAVAHVGSILSWDPEAWVAWGDYWVGAASVSAWDFVRCGVLVTPLSADINCDGFVNFGDINPFVQRLSDPEEYENSYPGCWPSNADINGDGSVDFGDINPFIDVLMS